MATVDSFSFEKQRLLKSIKKENSQTSRGIPPTSHISALGQNECHPLKRLLLKLQLNTQPVKMSPLPLPSPPLKFSQPRAMGEEVTFSNNICVLCQREHLMEADKSIRKSYIIKG